jgi:hypothetical protein
MDHIDRILHETGTTALNPSVEYVLIFACNILDKYYSKTDLSNVYQIAMDMFSILILWSFFSLEFCLVLYLQIKLKYFQQHGWERHWIEMVEEIVRNEFVKYDISDKKTAMVHAFGLDL